MRTLPIVVVLLALASCSEDDDGRPRAAATSTTSSPSTTESTEPDECPGGDPAVPDAADGSPAEIVAVAGDLRLAIVDRGASVEVVSIFRLDDCELRQVELDGQPVALPVGGTVTHGDGIRCGEDTIEVLAATSDDGRTYQATSITYEVVGDELREVERSASTIEGADEPDVLGRYYELDC